MNIHFKFILLISILLIGPSAQSNTDEYSSYSYKFRAEVSIGYMSFEGDRAKDGEGSASITGKVEGGDHDGEGTLVDQVASNGYALVARDIRIVGNMILFPANQMLDPENSYVMMERLLFFRRSPRDESISQFMAKDVLNIAGGPRYLMEPIIAALKKSPIYSYEGVFPRNSANDDIRILGNLKVDPESEMPPVLKCSYILKGLLSCTYSADMIYSFLAKGEKLDLKK